MMCLLYQQVALLCGAVLLLCMRPQVRKSNTVDTQSYTYQSGHILLVVFIVLVIVLVLVLVIVLVFSIADLFTQVLQSFL